jgi:hypothetical protein
LFLSILLSALCGCGNNGIKGKGLEVVSSVLHLSGLERVGCFDDGNVAQEEAWRFIRDTEVLAGTVIITYFSDGDPVFQVRYPSGAWGPVGGTEYFDYDPEKMQWVLVKVSSIKTGPSGRNVLFFDKEGNGCVFVGCLSLEGILIGDVILFDAQSRLAALVSLGEAGVAEGVFIRSEEDFLIKSLDAPNARMAANLVNSLYSDLQAGGDFSPRDLVDDTIDHLRLLFNDSGVVTSP